MLEGKNIVLGVTGGIAAYKACDIVSRLKKLGANIDVIMTKSAMEFVRSKTFETLSQNRVVTELFSTARYWDIEHISLSQKADIFLVAPATANIIGKVANGIADDILSTAIMASAAKVIFAPSMNTKMYENKIVQDNIRKLEALGYSFIAPEQGRLACGDEGTGKLAEPDKIIDFLLNIKQYEKDFTGKKILITAGPTMEAIDPVRYITNHSTGKMGYALAEAAKDRGAEVTLISGPTNLIPPCQICFIPVKSGEEMYQAVIDNFQKQDIIIKAAAVSDYRPEKAAHKKIKKHEGEWRMTLIPNPDILLELGKRKGNKILVGFAAETNNLIEHAQIKIEKKNLDLIAANDITEEGAGFGCDTNIIHLLDSKGNLTKIEKTTKLNAAHGILDKVKELVGNL